MLRKIFSFFAFAILISLFSNAFASAELSSKTPWTDYTPFVIDQTENANGITDVISWSKSQDKRAMLVAAMLLDCCLADSSFADTVIAEGIRYIYLGHSSSGYRCLVQGEKAQAEVLWNFNGGNSIEHSTFRYQISTGFWTQQVTEEYWDFLYSMWEGEYWSITPSDFQDALINVQGVISKEPVPSNYPENSNEESENEILIPGDSIECQEFDVLIPRGWKQKKTQTGYIISSPNSSQSFTVRGSDCSSYKILIGREGLIDRMSSSVVGNSSDALVKGAVTENEAVLTVEYTLKGKINDTKYIFIMDESYNMLIVSFDSSERIMEYVMNDMLKY